MSVDMTGQQSGTNMFSFISVCCYYYIKASGHTSYNVLHVVDKSVEEEENDSTTETGSKLAADKTLSDLDVSMFILTSCL